MELPSTNAATICFRSSVLSLFIRLLCLTAQAVSIRFMKKKVDSKSRRIRLDHVDQNEALQRRYHPLFEADFARKLEAVRKQYGSLAKFLKAQQTRTP